AEVRANDFDRTESLEGRRVAVGKREHAHALCLVRDAPATKPASESFDQAGSEPAWCTSYERASAEHARSHAVRTGVRSLRRGMLVRARVLGDADPSHGAP